MFQVAAEILQKLFEKYVDKVLTFKRNNCTELVTTSELNSVASLCTLFDALATEENGVCYQLAYMLQSLYSSFEIVIHFY